jgi:hypothetical protein
MKTTLKQLVDRGFAFDKAPRSDDTTVFRNKRDGNLYRVYLITPHLRTGGYLAAQRMFANGDPKAIPESRLKDYVVVESR